MATHFSMSNNKMVEFVRECSPCGMPLSNFETSSLDPMDVANQANVVFKQQQLTPGGEVWVIFSPRREEV